MFRDSRIEGHRRRSSPPPSHTLLEPPPCRASATSERDQPLIPQNPKIVKQRSPTCPHRQLIANLPGRQGSMSLSQ